MEDRNLQSLFEGEEEVNTAVPKEVIHYEWSTVCGVKDKTARSFFDLTCMPCFQEQIDWHQETLGELIRCRDKIKERGDEKV